MLKIWGPALFAKALFTSGRINAAYEILTIVIKITKNPILKNEIYQTLKLLFGNLSINTGW